MIEELQASLDLQGKAFLKIEENAASEVTGFYTLPAHRTEAVMTIDGRNVAYYRLAHRGKIFKIDPDEVLQINDYAPGLSINGIPLFKAVALSFKNQIASQALQTDLVQRGGEFSMVLTSPDGRSAINDPVKMRRLKLQFKKRYNQAPKRRAPLALPSGVKVEKTQLTPAELRLPEMMRMTREQIYEAYGVPLWLVGMQNSDNLGSGGAARSSERSFYEHTVMPMSARLEWALSVGLLSRFRPDWSCHFDFQNVFCLQIAFLEKAELVAKATGRAVLTVNEGREVLGKLPLADPKFDTLQDLVPPPGTFNPSGNQDPGAAAAAAAGDDSTKPKKPKKKPQPAYSAAVKTERRLAREKAMEREARHALRYVAQLFDQQERRVLTRIETNRLYSDHRIVDVTELLAESEEDRALLRAMILDLIERQGQDELSQLIEGADFKATNARVAAFHLRQTNRMLTETTETTRTALRERLAELAGDSTEGVVAAVRQAFEDRRANAVTIARTESASAYNFATIEAWRQTGGMVSGKRWVAIIDEHTRDSHAEADGQEVGLEEPFDVGGEQLAFPGDPDGAPENVINCRCTVDFVLAEEASVGRMLNWVSRAMGREHRNGKLPKLEAILERSQGWHSRNT